MGGDWNVVVNTYMDHATASGGGYTSNQGVTELSELLSQKDFRDVFRERYPHVRMYTRRDRAHETYTRLDRWYAPPIRGCQYDTCKDYSFKGSDHDPMALTVTWPQSAQRGAGIHRINHRILETDEVRDAVVHLRRNTVHEHAASGRSKGEIWDILSLIHI